MRTELRSALPGPLNRTYQLASPIFESILLLSQNVRANEDEIHEEESEAEVF